MKTDRPPPPPGFIYTKTTDGRDWPYPARDSGETFPNQWQIQQEALLPFVRQVAREAFAAMKQVGDESAVREQVIRGAIIGENAKAASPAVAERVQNAEDFATNWTFREPAFKDGVAQSRAVDKLTAELTSRDAAIRADERDKVNAEWDGAWRSTDTLRKAVEAAHAQYAPLLSALGVSDVAAGIERVTTLSWAARQARDAAHTDAINAILYEAHHRPEPTRQRLLEMVDILRQRWETGPDTAAASAQPAREAEGPCKTCLGMRVIFDDGRGNMVTASEATSGEWHRRNRKPCPDCQPKPEASTPERIHLTFQPEDGGVEAVQQAIDDGTAVEYVRADLADRWKRERDEALADAKEERRLRLAREAMILRADENLRSTLGAECDADTLDGVVSSVVDRVEGLKRVRDSLQQRLSEDRDDGKKTIREQARTISDLHGELASAHDEAAGLRKQRDLAGRASVVHATDAEGLEAKLRDANATIAHLTKLLARHGRHTGLCASELADGVRCDCGLTAAITPPAPPQASGEMKGKP